MYAGETRGRSSIALGCLLLFFLIFALAGIAHGQKYYPVAPPHDPRSVDATRLEPPLNLNGAWLAHVGDDPRYAEPSFDDRDWEVVATERPITSYFGPVDRLWYRTHVHVGKDAHGLALLEHGTQGSVEVYVNGTRLSALGTMKSGGQRIYDEFGRVIAIPDALAATGELTVAVRASVGRETATSPYAGLLPTSLITIGPLSVLNDQHALFGFRDLTSNSINLAFAIVLLLVALALSVTLRSQREYAALVIHIGAMICLMANQMLADVSPCDYTLYRQLFTTLFLAIHVIAGFEFYRIVLGIRRGRAILLWEIAFMAQALLTAAATGLLLQQGRMLRYTHLQVVVTVVNMVFLLPLRVGVPIAAFADWRKRRNVDALLLLVPVLENTLFDYLDSAAYLLWAIGHARIARLSDAPIPYFDVGWNEVGTFAYNLLLLLFIVVRALRLARDRATLDAEVRAAQSVQQLLLTRSKQSTTNFTVDVAYRPASEVGGDFFLVCPHMGTEITSPSIVAVVGDVSGKGLPAAMRVAMILGVLRREQSRDPAVILSSLNETLLDQNELGFTTACCVCLAADGQYAVANAGHINPYRRNAEVETAPALPLGLSHGETYSITRGCLQRDEHLLLVSDGIVEARSRTGELFGFDRLAAMAAQTADQIADAAQAFGQEDDITVMRLACAPAT